PCCCPGTESGYPGTMIAFALASASPSRLRILDQAGVDPLVRHPRVDEDALLAGLPEGTPHVRVVEELARAKAADVLEREGASLADEARAAGADTLALVGCDSMLLVDGQLEGKPHTYERAMERWTRLRGRHGVLLTGHALAVADVSGGGAPAVVHRGADTSDTTVHFGAPSDADLDVYLRTGEPLECAGPSRSSRSAAGSSTASTGTRRASSGSACRSCAGSSPTRVSTRTTSGAASCSAEAQVSAPARGPTRRSARLG